MALSLITNIGSLSASNALTNNETGLEQSIAQLSSGKRIVSASTDPAGFRSRWRPRGCSDRSARPAPTPTTRSRILQTADGALSNIGNLLQTAQQLATEAADGSYNTSQLTAIDGQYQAMLSSHQPDRERQLSSTVSRCSRARRRPSRSVRPTPPTISLR